MLTQQIGQTRMMLLIDGEEHTTNSFPPTVDNVKSGLRTVDYNGEAVQLFMITTEAITRNRTSSICNSAGDVKFALDRDLSLPKPV